MTAATGDTRSFPATRSTRSALALAVTLAAFCGASGEAATDGAGAAQVMPTPLGAAASGSPQIALPAGEPQALVVTPPAPGSSGPTVARGEGKVAAGRPMAFQFRSETAGLMTIGVSSPQSAARISIYLGTSKEAAAGTTAADGAIRWSSEFAAGETVKILVYTAGAEILFRVEAYAGPGGL